MGPIPRPAGTECARDADRDNVGVEGFRELDIRRRARIEGSVSS